MSMSKIISPIQQNGNLSFKEDCRTSRTAKFETVKHQQKSALSINNNNIEKCNFYSSKHEIYSKQLVDLIQNPLNLIVIDTREVRKYKTGHIKDSHSMNCTSRSMIIKAKKDINQLYSLKPHHTVVIYNEDGNLACILKDFIEYVKTKFLIVYFLIGGFKEFVTFTNKQYIEYQLSNEELEQHHFSPTNASSRSSDVLHATMTEILPFLYLGNDMDANDLDMLKEKQITHILNVTNSLPFYHTNQFEYKRLGASDSNNQNMRAHYDAAIEFIESARKSNGKVFVHCWAGVSRSATIVSAYLLKHTKLSVLDIIHYLKSKRSIVEPNFNFLGQLQRYYNDLENNIEKRTNLELEIFVNLEKEALHQKDLMEKLKLSSLNSNSCSSSDDNSPPSSLTTQKPFFTFIGSN